MSYKLRQLLDRLTRRITCSATFEEFLNLHPNYTPSIYPNPGDKLRRKLGYRCLALQYDLAQERRGDPRRAFQGQSNYP